MTITEILCGILVWAFIGINGAILGGIVVAWFLGPFLARRREEQSRPIEIQEEIK